jgi:hypothetical protein
MSIKKIKPSNLQEKEYKDAHVLDIRSHWADKLRKELDCLIDYKNEALKTMSCSTTHRNFPTQKDVVLDKITKIEILDTKDYPKLYDVTVPSTLNFSLANGINCLDTSETGYLKWGLKSGRDVKNKIITSQNCLMAF